MALAAILRNLIGIVEMLFSGVVIPEVTLILAYSMKGMMNDTRLRVSRLRYNYSYVIDSDAPQIIQEIPSTSLHHFSTIIVNDIKGTLNSHHLCFSSVNMSVKSVAHALAKAVYLCKCIV
nr:hypothetical protein Iba_chr12aCG21860 [Ipomoea batatas]GMD62825.1 hypothetical protein Iba_chr12bCG9090 [Ipomoea batatas]GMD67729.1 hypothetical protein Iba_chr12dCG2350 [Ipomoea batatas]